MSQVDLSFPLLSLLSKERAVYGLRNGDHERYRRHCANKIHRLRQTTGQTCGKGKQYKSPPKLDVESVKDVRHLQLLLFSAERALAHSHSLKTLKTKPNSTSISTNTLKKDQISWLRRSLKISTDLYQLITPQTDQAGFKINERTKAEIIIYQLSIKSELSFERSDFESSLTDLIIRRKLLGVLGENSKNSYDEALSNEFIDSQDPLIRYCAYKLGRSESHDIQGIIKDFDSESESLEDSLPGLKLSKFIEHLKTELGNEEFEKNKIKLNDIKFAGEKIEFRNAELVKIMIRVQDTLTKFETKNNKKGARNNGMRSWDKVLSVLGEAESVAKKLKDDHEASGSSTSLRSTEITASLNLAYSYIVHLLLSHRIKRDLSLIDTLSGTISNSLPSNVSDNKIKGGKVKVEEVIKSLGGIVKLLDTVLQSLRGISELSLVQEKEGVRVGVEGLENYYHALKCFYLARLHCLHPSTSYSSSVALLQTASTSIAQSRSLLINPSEEIEEIIIPISSTQIELLENDIKLLEISSKKGLFSQTTEKPIFFDMAFNYIDIPFDQLEILSGKKEKSSSTNTSGSVVDNLSLNVVKDKAVEGLKKLSRETRETTPAVEFRSNTTKKSQQAEEDDEEEEGQGQDQTQGKKGWLGGWFGRGK